VQVLVSERMTSQQWDELARQLARMPRLSRLCLVSWGSDTKRVATAPMHNDMLWSLAPNKQLRELILQANRRVLPFAISVCTQLTAPLSVPRVTPSEWAVCSLWLQCGSARESTSCSRTPRYTDIRQLDSQLAAAVALIFVVLRLRRCSAEA
jgi:hypothetical protein